MFGLIVHRSQEVALTLSQIGEMLSIVFSLPLFKTIFFILNYTWYEELTHLKRPWCWERWKAGGEGDNRGWDGWMASSTQWTWVWVNSGSWWWTGRPGMLRSMGSKSQTWLSDWTELNWNYIQTSVRYLTLDWNSLLSLFLIFVVVIVVVQLLSRVQLFATP